MLGDALPQDDPATTALITNDKMIAVDQDPLAIPARRVSQASGLEVWVKPLKDGSKAIGMFNRGDQPVDGTIHWPDCQLMENNRSPTFGRIGTWELLRASTRPPIAAHGVVLLLVKRHRP